MTDTFISIASRFSDDVANVKPLEGGNINETFRVDCADGSRFILQRISTTVFPDPAAIMRNLRVICEHSAKRLADEEALAARNGAPFLAWRVPQIVQTLDGADYAIDGDGGFWRATTFIENSTAWPTLRDVAHAREVGYALGRFQSLLSNLGDDALTDTLPGFHVTPGYLAWFDHVEATAEAKARAQGNAECLEMLRFIEAERERATLLEDALARGDLRLRTIHGDPKVSNVMIDDSTSRAIAMIDLDTTKPGLIHYDFGDCVRSTCNPAGEEPENAADAHIDLDALREVATGYIGCAGNFLSDADRALLYDSVRMIAFELSLRFFTDYLDGSRYFRVSYPEHNLHRATVQRILCQDVARHESAIRSLLDRVDTPRD